MHFCRISQPPSGAASLALNNGFDPSSLSNPAPGVYRVALMAGIEFADPFSLAAIPTQLAVTCCIECIDSKTVQVTRCAEGGVPQNGDVWIQAFGAVPTS